MPLTSSAADAFGVVTICLVALLVLVGLLCILYSFYFRTQIHTLRFVRLSYFSGPWIIRIALILFAIWWGFGEIIRLSLLRHEGRVLNAVDFKWQETVCKCYLVSSLGFAEPCLLLTLVFLLRAPLQNMESGTLSRNWNGKTTGYVLIYCLPVFILQLFVILIGPELNKGDGVRKLPYYFTRTAAAHISNGHSDVAFCTYPLLNTIVLGVFATFLTMYLLWLGRRILNLVINKNLQKRVYALIFSVSGFLPLRVGLLGLSVLSRPEHFPFEVLVFCSFLALLCCTSTGIFIFVYWPIADSLALRDVLDLESRRRISDDQNDTISLISLHEESTRNSLDRNSDASTKSRSISFRTSDRDDVLENTFVELSLFSPSRHASPPGSPQLLGWSPTQVP